MKFDKIVRDKVPEIIEAHHRLYNAIVVDNDTAIIYLSKKIAEEQQELDTAIKNKDTKNTIEEFADILECIDALAEKLSIPMTDVFAAAAKKSVRVGRFDKNIILQWVEGDKFSDDEEAAHH